MVSCRLASAGQNSFPLILCHLLESHGHQLPFNTFLQIVLPSGYVVRNAGTLGTYKQDKRENDNNTRLDVHAGGVDDAAQEREEQLLELPLHQVGKDVPPCARRPRVLLVHLQIWQKVRF